MWVRFPPSALAVECINKLKSFSWPVCAHRQINWPQLGTLHLIGRHYTAFMDYDKAGARRADDRFTETPLGGHIARARRSNPYEGRRRPCDFVHR